MIRAPTCLLVILVGALLQSATAATATLNRQPRRPTTTTTSMPDVEDKYYHPADVTKPRVLEQMDQRSLDGNFEYK